MDGINSCGLVLDLWNIAVILFDIYLLGIVSAVFTRNAFKNGKRKRAHGCLPW